MRPRGSITGPLVIILLGLLFLIHAVSPDFALVEWLGQYWPYLLIGWGVVALLEVSYRAARGSVIPTNGVSGGAWVVVILICLVGSAMFQFRGPDTWWRQTDWGRGFDNAFGEEHEYTVDQVQRTVGAKPHIVLQNFRGDAKITGVDGVMLTVGGHKSIRAMKEELANRANSATPVEISTEGKNTVISCHQDQAARRTMVTTNLELTIPRNASVEVESAAGDLDISAVAGDVNLRGGNAGMRLQDIGGNIAVDTHRSDLVRCTNVKGTVDLRGRGSDVELNKIGGQVTISGDYSGTISLRALDKQVRLANNRTDLRVEQIPGEVRIDRGSLSVQNAVGPIILNAHSTDISVEDVVNAVEISLDRGDIDLKPGRIPLSRMTVHTGSGNMELSLPPASAFTLNASTDRGEVENDFGDEMKEQTSGKGARLEGSIGAGPNLDLTTGRGTITIRRARQSAPPTSVAAKPEQGGLLKAPQFVAADLSLTRKN